MAEEMGVKLVIASDISRRYDVVVRQLLLRGALLASCVLFTGFDCSGSSTSSAAIAPPRTWTHPQGFVSVEVASDPFAITISDANGRVMVESAPLVVDKAGAPMPSYGALAITHNEPGNTSSPMKGWDSYTGADDPWNKSTRVTSFEDDGAALVAHVATDSARTMTVRFEAQGRGVHLTATLDGADAAINRVSLGFKLHDDDHFFGFGERFVRSDHRGQLLYNWVEDAGFGHGESTPPGPGNPSPNGEGMAYIPIPWFLDPRGFGLLMNGTFRTVHHLGDESTAAWRVESWRNVLDATLFASPDPIALVEDLTGLTGRPPEIADYVLAPRRRMDPGGDEATKLRAAHIPTSVIDLDVHYFPNGGGSDSAAMKAMTADMHARGFKAVAYFCSFISDGWHPVFDEAVSKGYLIKHEDGSPYTVLDLPYNAGIVDFTNPDAVAWYQGWMQRALDDGWDGWMYDFAEYVPMDAVMHNGMRGEEAHNLYPVLYQKAMHDLLERQRRKDYLVFVRSGFTGTGGMVPMVWGGDNSTDFDLAKGLPATLQGALSAGMSGIPLWGSDISGYHFIYNPPPDKEVYLRWTEVGAFSADMHDENEGSGSPGLGAADRWQIWKDQESQDVYRKYATYKTRMLPYVKLAVAQARARGTPVMRHLYLHYPADANVYPIGDEYMYGDSLLVAPVVARGKTSRSVYLPEDSYFDFWTGARVAGKKSVDVAAPLDVVPVFARVGAIVPMLHPEVETVVPATDRSVVSMADRADYLEVMVFAGGDTSVTLDDGTVLSQSAPKDAFAPSSPTRNGAAIPAAAAEADLMTCDACWWDDAANHVWKLALKSDSGNETANAGPLALGVKNATTVKRFVFTVRH